jgi:hypothetical protein
MKPERFSASVAGKHMACHASANLELAIPGWTPPPAKSTKAADDGTDVHSIFEQIWEYSASDIKHMASVLDYVAKLRSTRRFKVMIEETIEATWLKNPTKTTPDLVLYTQDEIHVLDTKWGKIPVEVVENTQLLFGAVTVGPLAPKAKGVTGHILQPKAGIMDSWYMSADRLALFMEDALATEAAIAAGSTQFGPSDYCTFCPANPHTRGAKGGRPCCPVMMELLYPGRGLDEQAILDL